MPLYLDNEIVNKDHARYEEVRKGIASLRAKKTIIISPTWRMPDGELNPGVSQIRPNQLIPTESAFDSKETGMKEIWRYSESLPKKGNNGEIIWSDRSITLENSKLIIDSESKAELAYYLVNLSPLFKRGSALYGRFKIDDPIADAEKEVDQMSLETTVKTYIFSRLKVSPFYENETKLRDIAASWGVANSLTEHPDILRKKLFDKVSYSEKNLASTQRGYKEFIDELDEGDILLDYRVNINKALEKKFIGWDDREKAYYWLDGTTGEHTAMIISLSPTDIGQREKILLEYFRNDYEAYDNLQKSLSVKDAKNRYESMLIEEIKVLCKARNIKIFQMSKSALIAELIKQDENNV